MKKFVKLLAFVVDLAFTPIRFIVAVQTTLCACVVYEMNFGEAFREMMKTAIYGFKAGFKSVIELIFKD